jgi:hypothetical protein
MGGGSGRAEVDDLLIIIEALRLVFVSMVVGFNALWAGESQTNWSVSSKLTLDLAERERTLRGATLGVEGSVRDFVREEGVRARGCGERMRDGGGRGGRVRSVGVRESLPGGRGRVRVGMGRGEETAAPSSCIRSSWRLDSSC